MSNLADKLNKLLNHQLIDTCINIYKKFKSSKTYWGVMYVFIIPFLIEQSIAWKYGEALANYGREQLKDTSYTIFWDFFIFIFDIGGSVELIIFFMFLFLVLSFVKVTESEKVSISINESFFSLILLGGLIFNSYYEIDINKKMLESTLGLNKKHDITHEKLDEIDKKISELNIENEKEFLKTYFGEDWKKAFLNEQTYHNLKKLLIENKNDTQKLLTEKKELEEKIKANRLTDSIQKLIDKAFKELRYGDVRTLLDSFIEKNKDIESDLIKAYYQKALSYMQEINYHKAKEEFEEHIPPGIKNANILSDYGRIYYILGEYDKAIGYYEKALKIRKVSLGENHPSTATSYNNIGSAWHRKGEYDKAIGYYEKDLKITKASLGENHPSTATSYNNIGSAWHRKGEYDKAIGYYEKALKIRKVSLGENHPSTATSYNNMAQLYLAKNDIKRAKEYINKAVKIYSDAFPNGHPNLDVMLNNQKNINENSKYK